MKFTHQVKKAQKIFTPHQKLHVRIRSEAKTLLETLPFKSFWKCVIHDPTINSIFTYEITI